MSEPAVDLAPIRIGISSCLLGNRVRFDSGHKRDPFLTDTVGQLVEFFPVCPEVELGMGIPRETVRLERHEGEVRMIAPKSGTDHTDAMRRFAARRVKELAGEDLCGYVLKKDSPSCGMERVKVYDANSVPAKSGRGLFAEALLEAYPLLPVEEEGRLNDPRLRENFYERVFAYRRVKSLFRARWKVGDLVRFHTAEKLLLMAHDQAVYRELGRLVAGAKGAPRQELAETYQASFMRGLAKLATARKHVNVLQHVTGYFRDRLDEASRAELRERIEEFRQGLVPLIVPITLIRHHVRKLGVDYLAGQTYLEPHPKELMLRNHV